jgi:hypothetical protein
MFSQKIDLEKKWDADFVSLSPIFEPLHYWAKDFSDFKNEWPQLEDYQSILNNLPQPIKTLAGKTLKVVAQDGKPGHFNEHYAPRVYLTGEVQTRTENWHDFFQFLTWFMFPKTKAVINSIHVPAAQARIENNEELGRRSPIENMLSLFDEGGAVILCSDESLLQLIKDFKWKELFWQRRDELQEKLKLVTFGHALYEKGLSPYIGMTANCILLHVDEALLQQSKQQQLDYIDTELAQLFISGENYKKPKDLSPFPLLGLPGWNEGNEIESFYDNENYFRPGRNKNSTS